MTNVIHGKRIKLALVVDDSIMQCKILSVLLKEQGYRVFIANDGARGVDMFNKHKPDLVLMDINMPKMNGYEASVKMKGMSKGDRFCPIIFVTRIDTDQAFIESIEAGGDGFLVRPFSPEVFKAKIKSIQRISDLYEQIKILQQEQQYDAVLAEQLMTGVIEARNFSRERIGFVKQAAKLFSGDVQLTSLCPNGNINILLGDFTGHGLRSAIGAIPLSQTFRSMTQKGFSLFEIISQINHQLYYLLPADLFLCATFVSISSHDNSAYIFNGGLPDAYIFSENGLIKYQIQSSHPPMGVVPDLLPETKLTVVPVEEGDRVVLISDGIIEARNNLNEMYGVERLEQALKKGVIGLNVSDVVMTSVNKFCQAMPQEDDMSLIDIPCGGWEENQEFKVPTFDITDQMYIALDEESQPVWSWKLMLTASRLATVNPIPIVMNQLNDIEGSSEHWQSLYTILTELFVNALDHGVLGMSSELKASSEGFTQYYHERELRLSKLESGFVEIHLSYHSFSNREQVKISIRDSGKGFDIEEYENNINLGMSHKKQLSGRGIILVKQLCESVDYLENGSLVNASYIWGA